MISGLDCQEIGSNRTEPRRTLNERLRGVEQIRAVMNRRRHLSIWITNMSIPQPRCQSIALASLTSSRFHPPFSTSVFIQLVPPQYLPTEDHVTFIPFRNSETLIASKRNGRQQPSKLLMRRFHLPDGLTEGRGQSPTH